MEKEITFRNKKLGLLEAKLLVVRLKTGITKPNLTEEERADYVRIEECKKRDNEKAKRHGNNSGIWREGFGEKDYLLQKLNLQIGLIEMSNKYSYCKKHGHNEKINYFGSAGTYCQCKRCGCIYTRRMTSEEWESFDRLMKTPFNI